LLFEFDYIMKSWFRIINSNCNYRRLHGVCRRSYILVNLKNTIFIITLF